jgi:hypothetical protein
VQPCELGHPGVSALAGGDVRVLRGSHINQRPIDRAHTLLEAQGCGAPLCEV